MSETQFWQIIQDLEWDGDYERCAKVLLEKIKTKEIEEPQDFYNHYSRIEALINAETLRRLDNNQRSFEEGVSHGADDCHFMDLPAELIGRGQSEVAQYLEGDYKVPYEARECLSYMFHTLASKGLIKRV